MCSVGAPRRRSDALAAQPTSTGTSIRPAPCAVAIRNDQSDQLPRPTRMPDPAGVAEAGGDLVGGEGEQGHARPAPGAGARDDQPEQADRDGDQPDGQGVAEGDRPERRHHRPQPPLLQPRATAKSQPIAGFSPWKAPSSASESQGQSELIVGMIHLLASEWRQDDAGRGLTQLGRPRQASRRTAAYGKQ